MRSNTSFRIAFLMSTMHSMDPFLSPCDQIDSSVCSDTNHEAFRPVFSTFTMLLVDMDLPLNLKVMETVYTLTASALYGLTFFIFLNSFLPSFRVRLCWCYRSSQPSQRSRSVSCRKPSTPWWRPISPCSRMSSLRAHCTATTTWTASER